MNNDKDKYAELVDRIKTLQPQIPDPQRLISKTMDSIEIISKRKDQNKILTFVSISSSIAASFLIGMFLFEMLLLPKNNEFTSSKIMPVNITPALEGNNPTTLSEFSKILIIRKERQIEQRALYSNFINKYKIL